MAYVPSSLTLHIIHDSTDKITCSGSNNNLPQFPCIHMIGLRKISGKKSYGGIIKKESHFSAEKKNMLTSYNISNLSSMKTTIFFWTK